MPASPWALRGGVSFYRVFSAVIGLGVFIVFAVVLWEFRAVFEQASAFAEGIGGSSENPFSSPFGGIFGWFFFGGSVLGVVFAVLGIVRWYRRQRGASSVWAALGRAGQLRPLRGIVVSSRSRRISHSSSAGDDDFSARSRSYVQELALVVELEDGTCQRFLNMLPAPRSIEVGEEPMPGQRACVWRTPDGWSLVQVNADV